MFSSCYSKKYCIFVEKRLHLSNRSKLHCVRFALFLHVKGVFFLRVQIDCIMAFYFCIQIVTVRPLGRGINKIIRTMEKTNIYTDEERYWMTGGRTGTLPTRIIPSVIYSLAPNEIFVFGSNALGMHHAGALVLPTMSLVQNGEMVRDCKGSRTRFPRWRVSIIQSLPS